MKADTDACLVGLAKPFSMWNREIAAECIIRGEKHPDFLFIDSKNSNTVAVAAGSESRACVAQKPVNFTQQGPYCFLVESVIPELIVA
jgi:hypothetical protein